MEGGDKLNVRSDSQSTVTNTPDSGTTKEVSSTEDVNAIEKASNIAQRNESGHQGAFKDQTKCSDDEQALTSKKINGDSSSKAQASKSIREPLLSRLSDSDSSSKVPGNPSQSSEDFASRRRKLKAKKPGKKGKPKSVLKENMDSDTSDRASSDSSSDDSNHRKRVASQAKKYKTKGSVKPKKEIDDAESDSSEETSSSEDEPKRKAAAKKSRNRTEKRKVKSKRDKKESSDTDSDMDYDLDSESETNTSEDNKVKSKAKKTSKLTVQKKTRVAKRPDGSGDMNFIAGAMAQLDALKQRVEALEGDSDTKEDQEERKKKNGKTKEKKEKGSKAKFVRVDRLWSNREHRYVLKESSEHAEAGEFEEYAFHVCRIFDWQNKFEKTELRIVSKPLKNAVQHVMAAVRCISLEEETPTVDPSTLFLFREELRLYKRELKTKSKSERKKKKAKTAALEGKHLGSLIKYLDEDWENQKKSLCPLLESGRITFDLLWGLFKPNEIAYAATYGSQEQPRAFKIDYISRESSIVKGDYYEIEGRYLEYDGKTFGMGNVSMEVPKFNGPRKISSLSCYPLKYHKDHKHMRKQLIERGKNFTALVGMQYRFHKGMAFGKKRNQVLKFNLSGRVMIDPATFRRINANYPVSTPKPEDKDILSDSESECESDSGDQLGKHRKQFSDEDVKDKKKKPKKPKKKLVKDTKHEESYIVVEVPVDEDGNVIRTENFVPLDDQEVSPKQKFSDEEYLIASPVVLGFSFGEKLWLEFAVSGISDIQWNEGAFDSLIIPEDQKEVVKALVESHAFEQNKNIDDVIQGKGRGLVAVLHGPPGTGKTLTAEGIAEMLKKPLYAVTSGELGIRTDDVEETLTQILDIAHTWGALLLLDEADVFLEQREPHDISRNALVSIFLRMLEYFQGILFLTTNRVETFDAAFASRIHIGLRYGELSIKARKSVWKLFIERLKALPDAKVDEINEEDYTRLSNFMLNGREIKNSVRTAQSMALVKNEPVSMQLLLRVLLVMNVFSNDLKGPGYEQALKFYM